MIRNSMKKKTRTTLILGAFMALFAWASFMTPPALAADNGALKCNVLPQNICSSAKNKSTDARQSGILVLLNTILGILTGLVGVAAVGAFVYAGIMYSSAGGKSDQVAKAKTIMVNTVIGLIAFAIMGALLQWLIPGGLF